MHVVATCLRCEVRDVANVKGFRRVGWGGMAYDLHAVFCSQDFKFGFVDLFLNSPSFSHMMKLFLIACLSFSMDLEISKLCLLNQCSDMVLRVPFRQWVHVKYRNPQPLHGGFYCLLPVQGERVVAAVARYRHPAQLEYKAFSIFVREYADILGLGDNLIWTARDDLVKWLDALVHNSFMRHSTSGLRASFEGIGRTTWILIKHGCKAWPIRVVDGVMQNGWREFRTAHAITTNYRLILACQRKWIFNAIILDQNGVEVSYDWTMLLNEHWRQFHDLQGYFVTACLPSTIQQNLPLMTSGYWYMPQTNHLEDFQHRLQAVLDDLNLEVISVRMGNRTWSISINNGHLNGIMFNQLLDALQLQLYDYVFIVILPNLDVRVVILDHANDKERIYEWL
ncbi:hypothetical protein RHMOL_Rhmol08G0122900 [Rhododendron molle]|uniref:Uncharacterized protein n=1 Tax=Rhododendron molle TaxID=49168 RepID=A0ACC0MMG2_RHOML|nr:hypothetical protein RHMOL_Rhmol08G0122900 [Rhododendron molle]